MSEVGKIMMRVICIAEVVAGAGVLLLSICRYYRSLVRFREHAHQARTFSRATFGLCMALMLFFLAGYLGLAVVYLWRDSITPPDFLIANVFLFGAVFVYVVISVQDQMGEDINHKTEEIIRTLVNAVEAKDPYTRGHSVHVSNLTGLLYRHLPEELRRQVSQSALMDAAILHDIGKIGIPDSILNKLGRLSPKEMAVIRQHPRLGKQILEQTSFRELGDIILYHHERMDRLGYYRIPAENIPLESRMIAVTDTFSALYSDRVYRPRKSYGEACAVLRGEAGTQLDETLVEIFLSIPLEEINEATDDLFKLEVSLAV